MKKFIEKYSCYIMLLYFPIYLVTFYFIEHTGTHNIHIIECALDNKIPFIEYFIVPYLLWFLYVFAAVMYFLIFEKESFRKFMYVGMVGMTVFIIVSIIYPNGLQLRPEYFTRDNIFIDMTKFIYHMDTATNVFPSIHVFNSLAVHAAVMHSKRLEKHTGVQKGSLVLCILIILSTMFLKQHSVFDVISAFALFGITYEGVYSEPLRKIDHEILDTRFHKKVGFKGDFH